MNKKFLMTALTLAGSITLMAACGNTTNKGAGERTSLETQQAVEESAEQKLTNGQKLANILGSTNWQGTRVYDKDNNDLTKENTGFIGLAKYDAETGHYESFDAQTGETRGDEGTFFMTNDGMKRILISKTMNYQAVVEITELDEDMFTYKRMGKDAKNNDIEVFVEHIPFADNNLSFTTADQPLNASTGEILTDEDGDNILGSSLWQGTKAIDEEGNDVTMYNENYISLAKFDKDTNQYEFFSLETGESRGDYGYFNVINNNKIRAHMSIGENKYGAALELTELNQNKFTYKRVGKDADGNDITIFVEHEPYKGELTPVFSL